MHRRLIALLAVSQLAGTGFAADNRQGDLDFQQFTSRYYLAPQPERVADAIKTLHGTGFAETPASGWPFVAWFSEVFAANPQYMKDWRKLIGKQKPSARTLLQWALALQEGGGLLRERGRSKLLDEQLPVLSPTLNDMYWGAFFASGNPAYVQRIIGHLRYFDDRSDATLFWTGGTARWSLAANARTHPRVRSLLEAALADAEPRTAALIADALQREPQDLIAELQKIYQEGAQAGGWRSAPLVY